MSRTTERLTALGLTLPTVPKPVGKYDSYLQTGNFLFLSGHGARNPDGSLRKGCLGNTYQISDGYEDAKTIGLQLLATAEKAVGNLDKIRVIKVLGLVNAIPGFTDYRKVIDGCPKLFLEVLGEQGRNAPSAMGASLPAGLSVEIGAIFEIILS